MQSETYDLCLSLTIFSGTKNTSGQYKIYQHVNCMIVDYYQISIRKQATAAAVKTSKHITPMICFIFDSVHSEKGACGRYRYKQVLL